MQATLSLLLQHNQNLAQEIPINSKRFTIGSRSDNDLVIDDPQVAPRHAVIECFDDTPKLIDFDTPTGTFLNRRRLSPSAPLQHRDVITLGAGECNLTVQFAAAQPPVTPFRQAFPPITPTNGSARRPGTKWWLEPPVLAAIPVLLLSLGFLIYKILYPSPPSPPSPMIPSPTIKIVVSATPALPPTPMPTPTKEPSSPIESAAKQVIKNLGRSELPYVFATQQHVDEIEARIRAYQKQSQLVEAVLKALQPEAKRLAQKADPTGLPPPLVVLIAATVAVQKRAAGQPANPVAIAQTIQGDIIWHRTKIGYEGDDATLLSIASYGMGRGKAQQELLKGLESGKLTDAKAQRNIWYMHKNNMLHQQGYDFVLRVLAMGVIAQNPQQFQFQVAPWSF